MTAERDNAQISMYVTELCLDGGGFPKTPYECGFTRGELHAYFIYSNDVTLKLDLPENIDKRLDAISRHIPECRNCSGVYEKELDIDKETRGPRAVMLTRQ